jgi:hypothetical protein
MGRMYKRGERWWIEYWFRGEQHREPTGSSVRRVAVDLLRRRQAEMGRGHLVGPGAERLTFADLERMVVDDYKLKARRSKPPLAHLRAFFSPHVRALDITRDVVAGYVRSRLDAGAAPQTVKLEVGTRAAATNQGMGGRE